MLLLPFFGINLITPEILDKVCIVSTFAVCSIALPTKALILFALSGFLYFLLAEKLIVV
jgi:hypothetical protein